MIVLIELFSVYLFVEKINSSCLNNPCGTGKCFQINDPSVSHVCLCPNGEFGISCQSNDWILIV